MKGKRLPWGKVKQVCQGYSRKFARGAMRQQVFSKLRPNENMRATESRTLRKNYRVVCFFIIFRVEVHAKIIVRLKHFNYKYCSALY
jgi:hypothetical protein